MTTATVASGPSLIEDTVTLPVTPPSEIEEVWKRYKADQSCKELRNCLVENYLPLVKYNGERIWARLPEGVELDDLISAGIFGLMDAIDAFDMNRGVKFETYCVPRIRGAMLDELRTMDWVPRLVRSKASKLNEATKMLEAKLGRHPTEIELATHMDNSGEGDKKVVTKASGGKPHRRWFAAARTAVAAAATAVSAAGTTRGIFSALSFRPRPRVPDPRFRPP